MKIEIEKLPQISGITYQSDKLVIIKGEYALTYQYEQIDSIEIGDNLFKVRLNNGSTIAITHNPHQITITQPQITIDIDTIDDSELPLLGFAHPTTLKH